MAQEAALFCQVNKVEVGQEKSPVAQKHVPVFEIPGKVKAGEFFNARIKVGQVEHPMENDHHIQFLELYVGKVYLGRFDFTPVMTKAEVTVPIMLGHEGHTSTLRAFSRCNLHGIWEGDVTVKVE